ncbi:MAG: hypothetical protein NC923_07570, partial [Candidatus Omnitrophica bacterium]|nr:hypothetical protein [Candidatus Omnitrophota bacterium]
TTFDGPEGKIIRTSSGVMADKGEIMQIGRNDFHLKEFYLDNKKEITLGIDPRLSQKAAVAQENWETVPKAGIKCVISSWATYEERDNKGNLVFPKQDVLFGKNIKNTHKIAYKTGALVATEKGLQLQPFTDGTKTLFNNAAPSGESPLVAQKAAELNENGKLSIIGLLGWQSLSIIPEGLQTATVIRDGKVVGGDTKNSLTLLNTHTYTLADRLGGVLVPKEDSVSLTQIGLDQNSEVSFKTILQAGNLKIDNVRASVQAEVKEDSVTIIGKKYFVESRQVYDKTGEVIGMAYDLVRREKDSKTGEPLEVLPDVDFDGKTGTVRIADIKWNDGSFTMPFSLVIHESSARGANPMHSFDLNYIGGTGSSTSISFTSEGKLANGAGQITAQHLMDLSPVQDNTRKQEFTKVMGHVETVAPVIYRYSEMINGDWKTDGRTYFGENLGFKIAQRTGTTDTATQGATTQWNDWEIKNVVAQDTRLDLLDRAGNVINKEVIRDGKKVSEPQKDILHYLVQGLSFVEPGKGIAQGEKSEVNQRLRYNLQNLGKDDAYANTAGILNSGKYLMPVIMGIDENTGKLMSNPITHAQGLSYRYNANGSVVYGDLELKIADQKIEVINGRMNLPEGRFQGAEHRGDIIAKGLYQVDNAGKLSVASVQRFFHGENPIYRYGSDNKGRRIGIESVGEKRVIWDLEQGKKLEETTFDFSRTRILDVRRQDDQLFLLVQNKQDNQKFWVDALSGQRLTQNTLLSERTGNDLRVQNILTTNGTVSVAAQFKGTNATIIAEHNLGEAGQWVLLDVGGQRVFYRKDKSEEWTTNTVITNKIPNTSLVIRLTFAPESGVVRELFKQKNDNSLEPISRNLKDWFVDENNNVWGVTVFTVSAVTGDPKIVKVGPDGRITHHNSLNGGQEYTANDVPEVIRQQLMLSLEANKNTARLQAVNEALKQYNNQVSKDDTPELVVFNPVMPIYMPRSEIEKPRIARNEAEIKTNQQEFELWKKALADLQNNDLLAAQQSVDLAVKLNQAHYLATGEFGLSHATHGAGAVLESHLANYAQNQGLKLDSEQKLTQALFGLFQENNAAMRFGLEQPRLVYETQQAVNQELNAARTKLDNDTVLTYAGFLGKFAKKVALTAYSIGLNNPDTSIGGYAQDTLESFGLGYGGATVGLIADGIKLGAGSYLTLIGIGCGAITGDWDMATLGSAWVNNALTGREIYPELYQGTHYDHPITIFNDAIEYAMHGDYLTAGHRAYLGILGTFGKAAYMYGLGKSVGGSASKLTVAFTAGITEGFDLYRVYNGLQPSSPEATTVLGLSAGLLPRVFASTPVNQISQELGQLITPAGTSAATQLLVGRMAVLGGLNLTAGNAITYINTGELCDLKTNIFLLGTGMLS